MYSVQSLMERERNGEDITSKCLFFWKGFLSNWSRSKFKENNYTFDNNEQYMMYRKAQLFNDPVAEAKILAETEPKKVKKYGRQVKGFSNTVWDQHKKEIVIDGLRLKFSQNKKLKEKLLNTGDEILVEASPFDHVWGIKMNESEAKKSKVADWRGENLLGECLMIVRDEMKKY